MMGWLKNRMHKNYDDYEDIRSNVVGKDLLAPPEPDFPPRRIERSLEVPRFEEPVGRFEEPPGFSTVDTRFPEQPVEKNSDRYEILDRLNLIESQLAAIRSMTETINERLKNLERLASGRRY
ncbi:MAG TPA: hypothetical protein HA230_04855 [Candidatus Aenigmarchaeota archaeon]|nr:hypothetical protein [Candidatus Aenigmarchaeota archaeon]